MSKEELMVSLVVPTNGVIEWVFPVLDSIYQDEPEHSRFEVIVRWSRTARVMTI